MTNNLLQTELAVEPTADDETECCPNCGGEFGDAESRYRSGDEEVCELCAATCDTCGSAEHDVDLHESDGGEQHCEPCIEMWFTWSDLQETYVAVRSAVRTADTDELVSET